MPLETGKSREAFSHNVKAEIAAGKPQKQAVAIAYSEQRSTADEAPFAAGVLLRTSGNRALFVKRRDGKGWALPGGKIEDGETPEQAARRETQEETMYAPESLTQIHEGDGFVTFGTEVDEFAPTLNAEHTEYRWAPMTAPPQPLHPGVAAMLAKIAPVDAHGEGLDRREYDTNGWYEVPDNPLSKVGVYPYRESSVIRGGDRNKMVGVYRPAEELGSEDCVNSIRLMPWTDDHPSTLLGPKEDGLVPAEQKGVHGVIGEKTYFKDGTLYGNIKVFSEALARKHAAGKRELSLGYHCDFIPQEGVFEGIPYQYVQRNIRGNHLSSVDCGRMGAEVRVLDAADAADSELAAETRFTFSLDMREADMPESKRDDEIKDCVDAETLQFIGDSFNSLVGELEKKGYSKEYATKIAGKVAAEKGMTGHHDSNDSTGAKTMPAADATQETKTEEERKKEAADRRSARDSKRSARDALRAKDEMTAEEEEAEDAREAAEDAEEEKDDEKDESKEAKDRRSARDRRAGARDARKGARDRKSARDAKAAKDAAAKANGMDAAEVTALVKKEVAATAMDATQVAALIRKDETAKHRLYQRLSPIVGAFDHDEMSCADMATYGLKKLGAKSTAADPMVALDAFLEGFAAARGQLTEPRRGGSAQDSAGGSFVDKYIAAA